MPGARKTFVGLCASENSPLSKVQTTCETLPVMLAAKRTRSGATPSVTSALAVTVGRPVSGFFRNQGIAVGSVLKKARSWWATFGTPPVEDGWVKSLCKSLHSQVKPSPRGVVPSAHKYGPQESHGTTA